MDKNKEEILENIGQNDEITFKDLSDEQKAARP